ncbi:hypothetical protein [Meiothermus sp.]|nr:hypothetical protein [Meiothermus sp.]GIW33432.1 MAG: hypothetical protein KatS3mg072_0765 [Meiothermus sp.]
MRKTVASLLMTLDGVVESLNLWIFDFGSPTLGSGVVLLSYAQAGGRP